MGQVGAQLVAGFAEFVLHQSMGTGRVDLWDSEGAPFLGESVSRVMVWI